MAGKNLALKDKWDKLPPKRRQQVALVGVLGGVGLLAFTMLAGAGPSSKTADAEKLDARVENSLLPDANTRDIGMSGVANDLESARETTQSLEEKVTRLEELLAENKRAQQEGGAGRTREEQLRAEMEDMKSQLEALKANGVPASGAAGAAAVAPMASTPEQIGYSGMRTISNTGGPQSVEVSNTDTADEATAESEGGGQAAAAAPVPKMYLPPGSIVQGVMLTGLDAPTGKGALKDPVPVLVRIQKDAILPNRFRADIKECFALVAGQGDMASERAYLRSETISCVRQDKSIIDLNMKAYVVDTDGKAGLRGRLVSKQGSVVSKAILASFADGLAQAFKGNAPNLQLGGNQEIDYGSAGQAGAIMGVSSSLDRISKYYLDLADQMFPILEIDAGRSVTMVLVKGLEMAPVR